ncbi:hypothetical protein HCK46_003523, partial [Salmonella enterica]|nr:hypothetical protein [Salmonella enterica]EEP7584957.1 hypothetical protein [Salmonella enterica]
TIKGLNTGVIRHNDKFIALALKVKSLRNKETLLFFPVLALRDLLIGLEHRLYLPHSLPDQEQEKRQKAKNSHVRKMHENIPAILREELENADINKRVESLSLSNNAEELLTFTLNLHNGSHLDLQVGEWQVEVLVMAIIHAINNAEMRELALRITSMLDFLPLYDADCLENGNLEFDSYDQPDWKHNLYDHYLALVYRYMDESGQLHDYGTVIKTRSQSGSKEAEAISRRLLNFSPRLKKLEGKPCKVFVRTLGTGKAARLTQDQCMRALHNLRMASSQEKR